MSGFGSDLEHDLQFGDPQRLHMERLGLQAQGSLCDGLRTAVAVLERRIDELRHTPIDTSAWSSDGWTRQALETLERARLHAKIEVLDAQVLELRALIEKNSRPLRTF